MARGLNEIMQITCLAQNLAYRNPLRNVSYYHHCYLKIKMDVERKEKAMRRHNGAEVNTIIKIL
jgi:hypothetical protein